MVQSKIKTERRAAQRFSLHRKATYEVSTKPTSHAFHTAARIGVQILNVSEGGVCLSTREALKPAQIIKIDLPLPVAKATAPTIAEVRWVSKGPGKDGHQAGLRFLL